MKKSKILVALLLAFVMVFGVVSLVACDNGGNGGEGGNGGSKDKPIELLLWAPSGAQTFYKEWANKWAADYKDAQGRSYTVKLGVMEEGDVADPLMTSPTDGADVFLFADDQVAKLYQNNVLADLGTAALAQEIRSRNSESSVESASYDGKLLAYPMQADNTYFLYYNSDMLSEEDVATWDSLFAAVAKLNQKDDGTEKEGTERIKVQFAYGTGWYQAAWFFSFGGFANETETNFDDPEIGYKALQAAYEFSNRDDITFMDPNDLADGLMDNSLAAGVAGTWIYTGDFAKADNIKMAVLPKIRLSGDSAEDPNSYVPMKSFISCKLIGVNAQGEYVPASHALANYLTSEEVQVAKALTLGAGPSNKVAAEKPEVKALPTVQVVAAQSNFAVPQINLPAGFWSSLQKCVEVVNAQGTGADYFNPNGTPKTDALDQLLAELRAGFFPSL